ncbi:MAG: hypothetical protein AAF788_03840 [Pseudomonadota bacterium]
MIAQALIGAALLLSVSGCLSASSSTPAVIIDQDALSEVAAAVGEAIGRPRFDVGLPMPTEVPELVVLPRGLSPLETRSPARPRVFDITLDDGACVLNERDATMRVVVSDRLCRPI